MSVHNCCIKYVIMMHTYHHGIVGQGVISTSYSMIYDLMGVTLASVWV